MVKCLRGLGDQWLVQTKVKRYRNFPWFNINIMLFNVLYITYRWVIPFIRNI